MTSKPPFPAFTLETAIQKARMAENAWNGRDPQAVATAILYRLLHHNHVLTVRGDSYRLREKRRSGLIKSSSAVSTVPATGDGGGP